MRTRDSGIARATIALWDAMASLYDDVKVVGASRFEAVMDLPRTIKPVQIGRYIPLRKNYWTRAVIPALSLLHKFTFVHFPWNVVPVRPKRDARVILTIHDLIPLALPDLYLQSEELVATYKSRIEASINRADLIITDSHCSKNDILKYFRPKTEPVVVYLANTMPTDSRYMEKSARERETYFVFLGGYEQRKGLDVLVRVYLDLFLEKQISFPLVLIGYPNHYSKELHDDIERGTSCGAFIQRSCGWIIVRGTCAYLPFSI
jgi:glycosyltransferase involved in cell wall biosynthesis